jgi:hypothetical protein
MKSAVLLRRFKNNDHDRLSQVPISRFSISHGEQMQQRVAPTDMHGCAAQCEHKVAPTLTASTAGVLVAVGHRPA